MIKRYLTSILLMVALAVPASADCPNCRPCPNCGKIHAQPNQVAPGPAAAPAQPVMAGLGSLPGQHVAQMRADYMATNGYRNHPPNSVGGGFASVGGMEGVGWSSRANVPKREIRTCRPSGPGGAHDDNSTPLVGDAVAYGAGGSYRVRIWERSTGGPIRRVGGVARRGWFRRR